MAGAKGLGPELRLLASAWFSIIGHGNCPILVGCGWQIIGTL